MLKRSVSKFDELLEAATQQESREEELAIHIQVLLSEILPQYLRCPKLEKPLVHFMDITNHKLITEKDLSAKRRWKGIPFVFGKEAQLGFALRIAKHTYIPLLLVTVHLPHEYSFKVQILDETDQKPRLVVVPRTLKLDEIERTWK